jgi:hypothetical protein
MISLLFRFFVIETNVFLELIIFELLQFFIFLPITFSD